ncbi:MAG TPA: glycosyltransferase family 39 protein, partial [Thermoanaerobaculia bacterium]|nr:glycosyltransferase family 39 protein [Thermoanaerobaculia bacterium]
MRRRALLGIVLLAAAVRLFGLDFDQGHFFHPDERAIANAVLKLSFSPFHWNPEFFAYGSLPFYLTKLVATPLAAVNPWFASYDGALYTGRALSALFGAATVLLLFTFAKRLYGETTALLASLLLALAVLPLQNAHYGATDTALAFFALLSVGLLARYASDGRPRDALLGGAAFGFALATKFSAAPLAVPLLAAVVLRHRAERKLHRAGFLLVLSGVTALAAFAVAQPYAFLDFGRFSHDVLEQSRMVRHAGELPYTNQYLGTPKLLYQLSEMALWGMGPLLFLAALVGTSRAVARVRKAAPAELVALAWVVPYFLVTCTFDVKFPRYLLPLYPFFLLWGAKALDDAASRGRAGRVARAAVVAGTGVYALAFLTIYTREHTIVAASRWFYANVPAGTRVLSQDWDEGFPFPLPGLSPDRYRVTNFGYYAEDTPEKMARLAEALAASDGVVLQTKRIYGAVTRAPEKFPLTTRYFRLLFAGDVGFVLAKDVTSRPGLLGIALPDELADESFTVYDHPKWLWFENRGRLPAAEIERKILSGVPSRAVSRRDMLLAAAGKEAGTAAPAGATG